MGRSFTKDVGRKSSKKGISWKAIRRTRRKLRKRWLDDHEEDLRGMGI